MRYLAIVFAAGVLFGADASAQQDDRDSDRRVRHHRKHQQNPVPVAAPRAGDADPYAPKVGAPDPYAPKVGAPDAYAPKAGAPNPYATRGGDPVQPLPTSTQGPQRR